MDLIKILKGMKNLNDYISITQELNHKFKNAKISLNMSTVLSLKNIRSLEIEYFNKCHDSGAAFDIFERLLSLPPSKTWSLLGKELVTLLQYWLDAVRKHLISHHPHWWSFLKSLLKFIKELSKKEHNLNNTLVQELSECLLDLATRGHTNMLQRHEILHTFNQYCAESGREIRMALRIEFDHYFVRLSTMMASCGHVPTQYSTLETLLRWLLPRRDPCMRQEAATRWLPDHLYSSGVRQVFLERPWMNFFQDARDLLNAHNQNSSHVTSVMCRKLSIGEKAIMSGTEKRSTWLDLNCGSGSLSILLDPKGLEALNLTEYSACETILISNDNTRAAKLYKESVQVILSITTLEPPKLFPSCTNVLDSCDVTAVISGRTHFSGMDAALRTIFEDKYEVLIDVDNDTTMLSPETFVNNHEEDTRFSHPAKEGLGRGRSGYTAWSRNAASWKSPSTASTTSLAQLQDKLAALPHYRFDKEPVSVCAQPKLSRLTELSESDDKQSIDNSGSTLKLGQYGVCHRRYLDKSQSDSEVNRSKIVFRATESNDIQADEKTSKKKKFKSDSEEVKKTNTYSKIVEDSHNASLLLVATVGSADECVINDTLERLSTKKDYSSHNIVDLLVQEALQAKTVNEEDEKYLDSGINTGNGKKIQDLSETIENTPDVEKSTSLLKENKTNTIISKSTSTDESNAEAINDTPMCFVNVRKKNPQCKNLADKNLPTIYKVTHEIQSVEDFFSQHFYENNRGELMISPTLARKINETSSESSEFGGCLLRDEEVNINFDQHEITDIDIIQCLNYMVDKVCNDFDKYLEQEKGDIVNISEVDNPRVVIKKTPLRDVSNTEESGDYKENGKDSKTTKKRGLKLRYNLDPSNKRTKALKKKTKSKNKLLLEPTEMSNENKDVEEFQIPVGPEKNLKKTSKMKPRSKNDLEMKSPETSNKVNNNNIHEESATAASPQNNSSPVNKNLENRLPRKKRKLYSPKDDHIIGTTEHAEVDISIPSNNKNEEHKESDSEDMKVFEFRKRNSITPKTTATSYRDIEKDRKKISKTRAKKVASPISPKTRKLNEVFDHLKVNIDSNEKITLADKKDFDVDMAIFNFTSDSEDEDFKNKKVDIQKRISTNTVDSGNSVISRRGRTRSKVDYKEKEKSSSDETVKPVTRRRGKRQNSKAKILKAVKIYRPVDLVDEKMRANAPYKEVLETSIVTEKTKTDAPAEPNPAIQLPKMELIAENEINATIICDAFEENKKFNKNYRTVSNTQKATTTAALEVIKENEDDGTISPLPGLLVEPVAPNLNYEDSLTSNFVKKIKKMYKTGADLNPNDTNTTHNLLSDNEKANHSLQMDVTDEFNIQENIEDNASFDVNATYEIKLGKKSYSDISPKKIVELTNKGNKSTEISKNNRKRRNLRLKSSDTANQSDSDTKYCLRSIKTSAKTINCVVEPAKLTNINKKLQNLNPQSDIICIDDVTPNSAKSYTKVDKNQQVIQINEDGNSEKSIATDGITAHGDLVEEPPSQKSLEQLLVPREMADMEESVLDYYVKLRKEIDNSRYSHSDQKVSSKENVAKNKVLSPVLSVKRISSDEIRKLTSSKSKKDEDYDYKRWLPSLKDSDSDENSKCSGKSPSVSLIKLSSKEIDDWINKPKNNKSFDQSRFNSSDNANMSSTPKQSFSNRNETVNEPNKRKSIISPIKLWEDIPKRKYPSNTIEEKPSNETSSKEVSRSDLSTPKARRYLLRKFDNDVSSPESNLSTSTRILDSIKQKSPAKKSLLKDNGSDVKKRKLEVSVVLTESGPSMSSVDDWLMKMDQNKAGLVDASISDTIYNIMERLDTTVNEIHQNTSNKFVHLFVDAQRHLSALKAEQREMRRQTATNIITRVAQVIDEEFTALDRRSQQVQESFMATLKQQAIKFIKDDSKQKRDMVLLLQEDVQSAFELAKKSNT